MKQALIYFKVTGIYRKGLIGIISLYKRAGLLPKLIIELIDIYLF